MKNIIALIVFAGLLIVCIYFVCKIVIEYNEKVEKISLKVTKNPICDLVLTKNPLYFSKSTLINLIQNNECDDAVVWKIQDYYLPLITAKNYQFYLVNASWLLEISPSARKRLILQIQDSNWKVKVMRMGVEVKVDEIKDFRNLNLVIEKLECFNMKQNMNDERIETEFNNFERLCTENIHEFVWKKYLDVLKPDLSLKLGSLVNSINHSFLLQNMKSALESGSIIYFTHGSNVYTDLKYLEPETRIAKQSLVKFVANFLGFDPLKNKSTLVNIQLLELEYICSHVFNAMQIPRVFFTYPRSAVFTNHFCLAQSKTTLKKILLEPTFLSLRENLPLVPDNQHALSVVSLFLHELNEKDEKCYFFINGAEGEIQKNMFFITRLTKPSLEKIDMESNLKSIMETLQKFKSLEALKAFFIRFSKTNMNSKFKSEKMEHVSLFVKWATKKFGVESDNLEKLNELIQ